ncbi:MAG TPA: Fe-S protein assembly co-chaperone HscB [Polyangia bacterium]|nr:Fe-S protein assembly co-chaperone HscB [Polyangia bacterium]
MVCWSCEKAAGGGMECAHCGALLPPDPGADFFGVLGVERRYDLDMASVEQRYRELTRKLHPDRFARADPRARRASLARSVQLNEAWRALKDPVRRAEYLLGLMRAREQETQTEKETAPPALLAEILELRQELGEARLEGDDAKVQQMATAMRARAEQSMSRVAGLLSGASPPPPQAVTEAAGELVAVRYYRRFLDEVAVHDEAVAAQAESGSGASNG